MNQHSTRLDNLRFISAVRKVEARAWAYWNKCIWAESISVLRWSYGFLKNCTTLLVYENFF